MTAPFDRLKAALADRYALDREIGRGGMATVYLAADLKHHRKVAIKVLHPEVAALLGFDRFLREIEIAARLQHPHILPLLDSGQADDLLYYAMPFIKGESLREKLARERELPVPEVARILRDVADALAHAHEAGVVHRDIKPENVMLSGRHALVTDFGIAKAISEATGPQHITTAGVALGTPAYMAPEQAAADPHTDHRADVYALGVLAYEMLTGDPPFVGSSPQAILSAHVTQAPAPVTERREMPAPLAELVMKCLKKKPADRWQSAEGILTQLETLTTSAAGLTPGVRPVGAIWTSGLGRRMIQSVVAIGVVLLAAAGWILLSGPEGPPRLVVLPFENIGSPEDEYFADGITEEITAKLASLRGLVVISRTSALLYKRGMPLKQISQDLGVQYVLEGTIRWQKGATPAENRVRVTPQLIRVADNSHVWAEVYDTVLSEVFAVQSSVAERVAEAMNVQLLTAERQALAVVPTKNQEANDYFWKGNALRGSEGSLRRAVDMYDRAIKLDTMFAAAYRQLSQAHLALYINFDQTEQRLRLARRAAERARDFRREEGQWALGRMYYALRDYGQAREHFELAAVSLPNESDIIRLLSQTYLRLGDWPRAHTHLVRAVARDPQNAVLASSLGFYFMQVFQFDESVRWYDRAIELEPENSVPHVPRTFSLLEWKGRVPEVDSAVARALRQFGAQRFVGQALAWGGPQWVWGSVFATDSLFRTALESAQPTGVGDGGGSYYLSRAALYRSVGAPAKAKTYADSALLVLEPRVKRAPRSPVLHAKLGVAYAAVGLKEAAVREGKAGLDLGANAVSNGDYLLHLGIIYFLVGEREAAIETLAKSSEAVPGNYTRMYLRAIPLLAPLLDDPRLRILPLPLPGK